jgi:hypothetical protein
MSTIIRQLELVLATLTLMGVAALAGAGWAIFAVAYIGGHAISQYDSGSRAKQPQGGEDAYVPL